MGERLGGVITALNLGWTQDIPYEQRLIVQRTGTAHLLAISGLHVGMVTGMVAWLLRWAWSLLPRITETLPAPTVAAFGAIVAALVYSEMAGFACSAQRACVMCVLLFLPKIAHRHMAVKTALFRAVWVVLLWDPCVVQSSGFWLSFLAVFVLVYARYTPELGRWAQHLEAQWVCLIGLLPLSCWYFHQVSLVSILANLIAIPVVGFVVLPLVLLGTAFALNQTYCAKLFFRCDENFSLLRSGTVDFEPTTLGGMVLQFCLLVGIFHRHDRLCLGDFYAEKLAMAWACGCNSFGASLLFFRWKKGSLN